MFKNGKIVGLSLALSCVSGVGAQFAVADGETETVSDDLTARQLEQIGDDIHSKAVYCKFLRDFGRIEESEIVYQEILCLAKQYGLDIPLLYENNLDNYAALFDLSFYEDLDRDVNWVLGDECKDDEIKNLINLDAMYTKYIIDYRNDLRSHRWEDEYFVKLNLAFFYCLREETRKKLAVRVAKFATVLEKHFMGSRYEENIKDTFRKEEEKKTQSNTSKKENEEVQSLVRPDAVSSKSWSFSDIVFGIKNKVESLLGLKEEEKEFVSKEEDLKREAKRQETEFSLSLMVNRFLSWMRSEGSAKTQSENVQDKKGFEFVRDI